jgi:hypothetical protein
METNCYGYLVEYARTDGRAALGKVTAPNARSALASAIARLPGVSRVLRVNRIPGRPVAITPEELARVRAGAKTSTLL